MVTKEFSLVGMQFEVEEGEAVLQGPAGTEPITLRAKVLIVLDEHEGVLHRIPFPYDTPPGLEGREDVETPYAALLRKLKAGVGPQVEVSRSMPSTPPPGRTRPGR